MNRPGGYCFLVVRTSSMDDSVQPHPRAELLEDGGWCIKFHGFSDFLFFAESVGSVIIRGPVLLPTLEIFDAAH